MNKGISVIVPIYNTNIAYLRECVDSIVKQTYNNIEIILINDGSSNAEIEDVMCQYKDKDDRIVCISKENSGVSNTRDIGIEKANKEWIMFVDADDVLEQKACEELMKACVTNPDIVISKNFILNQNNQAREVIDRCTSNILIENIEDKKELIASIFREKNTRYHYVDTPWAKLYRREFIINNNIRFREDLKLAEDGLFNFEAYMKASSIQYINVPTYYYRKNDESVCHKCNYYIINNYKKVFEYYNQQFEDINVDFESEYTYFVYRQVRNIIERYFCNEGNKKNKHELKEELTDLLNYNECKQAIRNIKIKELDKMNKIMLFTIRTNNFSLIRLLFRLKKYYKNSLYKYYNEF